MSERPGAATRRNRGEHLEHVDAMRPLAQATVISTHALLFFAPAVTGLAITSALTFTRFSRESFFFITALVLTLTCAEHFDGQHFWRRRVRGTLWPYLTWTAIYYVYISARAVDGFPFFSVNWRHDFSYSGLHQLVTLVFTGYYQLYFIVVLFQFYVLFPFALRYLQRSRRRHVPVLLVALVWQVILDEAVRHHLWHLGIGGKLETRLILSYPVFLLGGMVAALNYEAFHSWVRRRAWFVVACTGAALALALVLDAHSGVGFVSEYVRPGSDVYALIAVAYNAGAVLTLYLVGTYVTAPHRSLRVRRAFASGADASYGAYLSQMLWIPLLVRLAAPIGLEPLQSWFLVVPLAVVVTCAAGYLFTRLWRVTPLSPWLVGRPSRLRAREEGPLRAG